VRTPRDSGLDDRAFDFLRQRVIEAGERAGRALSPEQADAVLAATSEIGRRLKSARDAYRGYMLEVLEASGLPAGRACAIVDWFARGKPTRQPTGRRVSVDQRRRMRRKCQALDLELRDASLDPPPAPRSPSQQEREAFAQREEAWRVRQAERLAERPPALEFELSFEDFARPVIVAGLVSLMLSNEPVAAAYADLEEELREALSVLGDVAPLEYRGLVRWVRLERPLPHDALAWLVCCTPAARRAAERAGVSLATPHPARRDLREAPRPVLGESGPITVEEARANWLAEAA
jgi:hypothetical protein